jgi:hypothetical protein
LIPSCAQWQSIPVDAEGFETRGEQARQRLGLLAQEDANARIGETLAEDVGRDAVRQAASVERQAIDARKSPWLTWVARQRLCCRAEWRFAIEGFGKTGV